MTSSIFKANFTYEIKKEKRTNKRRNQKLKGKVFQFRLQEGHVQASQQLLLANRFVTSTPQQ